MTVRMPHQIVVRVPPGLFAELTANAKANDRTVAQTVRRAIRLFLADEGGTP